jgi:hypothetical protein
MFYDLFNQELKFLFLEIQIPMHLLLKRLQRYTCFNTDVELLDLCDDIKNMCVLALIITK